MFESKFVNGSMRLIILFSLPLSINASNQLVEINCLVVNLPYWTRASVSNCQLDETLFTHRKNLF